MNLIDEAIIFATKAHSGQKRKFSNTPYILHPVEVAAIAATMTDDEAVLAAAVLHDTVEDCGVMPEELAEKFGKRVFALVQSETEDRPTDRTEEESWEERKEDSILVLQQSKNRDVKILWMSDKLSNLRSFYREYLKTGIPPWGKLHQKDPKKQEWYYRSIIACLGELSETAAYREMAGLIEKLFGED